MVAGIASGRAGGSVWIGALFCTHLAFCGFGFAAEPPPTDAIPLVLPWGHGTDADCIAFSDNGKRIVTGSADHTAIVWDAITGRELGTLTDPAGAGITSVAISADGRYVATGSMQGAVVVWDTNTRKKRRTLVWHQGKITSLAFRTNGNEVWSASADKSAVVWDIASGLKRQVLNTVSPITGGAISPDGSRVATEEDDGTIVLWDLANGNRIRTHQGKPRAKPAAAQDNGADEKTQPGNFVAFSPDGKRLAAASPNKSVTIWNTETGEAVHRLEGNEEVVNCVGFSSDGKRLVTTQYGSKTYDRDADADAAAEAFNHLAIVWDATSGKQIRTLKLIDIVPLAVSPDGASIAVVSAGWSSGGIQGACLLSAETGAAGVSLRSRIGNSPYSISPAGQMRLFGPPIDTPFYPTAWEAEFAKPVPTFHRINATVSDASKPIGPYYPYGNDSDFSIQERRVDQRTSEVILSKTGNPEVEHVLMKGSLHGLTSPIIFSSDKKLLAFAAYEDVEPKKTPDRVVVLFDPQTGQRLHTFPGSPGGCESIVFSPDGTRLATNIGSKVTVWDTATGKRVSDAPPGNVGFVDTIWFGADGKLAASSSYRRVVFWDAATGEKRLTLLFLDTAEDWFAVTPDGLFDGSARGRQIIGVRVGDGMKVIPVQQGAERFYRPGLVSAILAGERPTAEKGK